MNREQVLREAGEMREGMMRQQKQTADNGRRRPGMEGEGEMGNSANERGNYLGVRIDSTRKPRGAELRP